ncbi:hypothetical protein [Pseudomonas mucidolens]|uniref:hypothetical protein n=1 Tax=Pseudomonas mucidolens TaxID=46679 RepID=UPI0030D89EC1
MDILFLMEGFVIPTDHVLHHMIDGHQLGENSNTIRQIKSGRDVIVQVERLKSCSCPLENAPIMQCDPPPGNQA